MKIEEYLALINELNEALEDNKFIENEGLCFSYHTSGYVDIIKFGEHTIYCSEMDSTWDYKKNIETSVKEVVIKNFKKYVKALNTIKFKSKKHE